MKCMASEYMNIRGIRGNEELPNEAAGMEMQCEISSSRRIAFSALQFTTKLYAQVSVHFLNHGFFQKGTTQHGVPGASHPLSSEGLEGELVFRPACGRRRKFCGGARTLVSHPRALCFSVLRMCVQRLCLPRKHS